MLQIRLLGALQITVDGETIKWRSRKAPALLAYLALTRSEQRRDHLADLLWSNTSPALAASNLRTILSMLRKAVGDYVDISRDTVALRPDADIWIDIHVLPERFDSAETQTLQRALLPVEGDFLEGFYLRNAVRFEEWALLERERQRRRIIEGYRTLCARLRKQQDWAAALRIAQRWLAVDTLNEAAWREQIWLLAADERPDLALKAYATCAQHLADELGVSPTQKTQTLAAQIESGAFTRPQRAQTAARHNLPPQLTPLVGRSAEIAHLTTALQDANCRIMTIYGAGGMGKTRLSLAVGEQLRPHFPDGVWFIPLVNVSAPDQIASAVLNTLGVKMRGAQLADDTLRQHLADQQLLLIFDNFEQLIASSAQWLRTMVEAAPKVTFLLTSRHVLNMQLEWLFTLEGLNVPTDDVPLSKNASAQLFIFHAQRRSRHFRPSQQIAEIRAICRTLAGWPLALELAAASLRHRTLDQLHATLQQNIVNLQTRQRDLPARHRSLQAVFDASWRLLTQEERRVLGAVSYFQGGFDLAAAEAVIACSAETLLNLVDKSLLTLTGNRWQMHEQIRQFASQQLPNQADVVSRHYHYFLGLAERLEPDLNGARPKQAGDILMADLDNLRLAWKIAVEQSAIAPLAGAFDGVHQLFHLKAFFFEWQRMLTDLLELTDAPPQFRAKVAAWRLQALSMTDYRDEVLAEAPAVIAFALETNALKPLARVYQAVGLVHRKSGQMAEAEIAVTEAVNLGEELQDKVIMADTLHDLGVVRVIGGDRLAAIAITERAKKLYHAADNLLGVGYTLGNLGAMTNGIGDCAKALEMFRGSADLLRGIGESAGLATALHNLGHCKLLLGIYDECQADLEQAAQIRVRAGMNFHLGVTRVVQSHQGYEIGDYETALRYLSLSMAAFESLGLTRDMLIIEDRIAFTLWASGKRAESAEIWQRTTAIRAADPIDPYSILSRIGLAIALGHQGDAAGAKPHLDVVLVAIDNLFTSNVSIKEVGMYGMFGMIVQLAEAMDIINDPRRAELVRKAQARLKVEAAQISSPTLRWSYLNKIRANVALAQLSAAAG